MGRAGPGAADDVAIVGRVGERRRLDLLVERLAAGDTSALVLVGEAGIGKSTLSGWARDGAARLGVRVVAGRGLPLTIAQPLQPVVAALDRTAEAGRAVTRSFLDAAVGDPVTLLAQLTTGRVDELARLGPLLLIVEDLHWVDRATLAFLHHLSTRGGRTPVGVLATTRPAVPGSSLHDFLTGVDTRSVVPVGALAGDEVEQLVEQRLGGRSDAALRTSLAACRGNPMLVEATLHRWLAVGPTPGRRHAPAPPIEAQVAGLRPEVLRVVQVAAVAGHRLRIDLLTEVTALPVAEVLDLLPSAVSAGVLARDDGLPGDDLVFRHDLHRDAVLRTLPESALRALHLAVAKGLDALGATRLELAEHVARGALPGNRAAVRVLVDAAEELVPADPATALRITDLALPLVGGPELPVRLEVLRVAALAACGQSAEAELLGRGLLRSSLAPEVEAGVRRDLALAAMLAGRPAESAAHMARVVAISPVGPAAAKAAVELAWAQFLSLDHRAARSRAEAALADADAAVAVAAHSLLCWLGMWHLDLAVADRAADAVEACVPTLPTGDWRVFLPLLGAAAVRLEQGNLAAARADGAAGRRIAVASGTAWAVPAYDALAAAVALRSGALDDAVRSATAALDGTALVDGFGVELWSRSLLALVALRRRDEGTASSQLEAARHAAGDGRAQLGLEQFLLADAALALAQERVGDAHRVLVDGWDLLSAVGTLYTRAAVASLLVRTSSASGERGRAEDVVATVEDDARRSGLPVVVGEALRARAELDRTPPACEEALAGARASGSALLELDVAHDVTRFLPPGHPVAERARARVSDLAPRLGLPLTAVRGAAAARPKRSERPVGGLRSLTEAERRVAGLVAEGLTNTEIAARLVVSRRTVDTQVLSAYRKLGVSSRVGLTRVLLERDPSSG